MDRRCWRKGFIAFEDARRWRRGLRKVKIEEKVQMPVIAAGVDGWMTEEKLKKPRLAARHAPDPHSISHHDHCLVDCT